jgi:hypothetical protein
MACFVGRLGSRCPKVPPQLAAAGLERRSRSARPARTWPRRFLERERSDDAGLS